jgi:osmotically-inducible protein OsmY
VLGDKYKLITDPNVVNCHVKVATGDADVCMSGSVADLGQRAATGESVRNESVPTVVDSE